MDLLITKTGMEVDKNPEAGQQADEEHIFEEVSFDRCFYIYGGLEQLEELEALSSHYTLLFNRRKAKLSPEQKSFYEGKLKQVQQIFSLSTEGDENGADSDKGKQVETVEGSGDEMKILCDASVSKDADMAVGDFQSYDVLLLLSFSCLEFLLSQVQIKHKMKKLSRKI